MPFQITLKDGESGFTHKGSWMSEPMEYTPRARLDMGAITRYGTYTVRVCSVPRACLAMG
jgi:hypothetical protein